ncbi:MAG TPA: DUF512 domain-containing protein [Candidatus Gastranaerophilales bacterium]|nr:DUF512 domain-containing protein [Candidatus Gastranaerophilales bacterium]
MVAIVNKIEPNSIAEELKILPGDEIISIDEVKPHDLIDYKYLISSEEISLHIKRTSGEEEIIDIEKEMDDDLGITFESAVFDKVISCNNKCVFCFVDQQPCGLRNSLYIKDDDYRLSYLQGTYITLTNLRTEDRKRIEKMRLGPLYISVHTTNAELRSKMLNNPKAGKIMQELQWLNKLEIPVHTQIVLCPDLNDKEELEKTLDDLLKLKSNIASIAVVPIGITKYRTKKPFRSFSSEESEYVINQIANFNQKAGYSLAVPSDEFYINADLNIPEHEFYRGYEQLEDGVGAARLLLDDYKKHKRRLPKTLKKRLSFTIATGQLACDIMKPIIDDLNKIKNLNINLVAVKNNFWGDKVTVSGLVTGNDLLESLLPFKKDLANLVIPSVMLRKYTDKFLDNVSLAEIEEKLGVNITVIENYYGMKELIDLILADFTNVKI